MLHIDPARFTSAIAATKAQELLERGYCIIPDLVPQATVAALHDDLKDRFVRTPFCQGDFYGSRTKRFGGLLKRSRYAEAFVANSTVLEICQAVLGPFCDSLQLNLTQALELHPGAAEQLPHRDQDMWRGERGRIEYLVNVMWPFTSYTDENGATLVWPDSHRFGEAGYSNDGTPLTAEMEPGAALLFLGSTLHGAGANRSPSPRSGMIVSYCLGWLKPYENQWLVYPPRVARHFSPDLADLVGYRLHRPNLGNYEGRCPSVLLQDEVPDYLGAIDSFAPDQAQMLAQFIAARRNSAGATP